MQTKGLPKPYIGENRTEWWRMCDVIPEWGTRWIGLHWEEQWTGFGYVWVATWWTYGDRKHTWWEASDYEGWSYKETNGDDRRSRPY